MQINVFVDRESKTHSLELKDGATAKDALKELKISPAAVIIARDNELIIEDEKLNENDSLKILSVISGG